MVELAMRLSQALETSDRGIPADHVQRKALVSRMFNAEGRSLVRLARIFTDDRASAEDLVQEAFIRLYHSAHRIEDPAKVAPYLRSILLNLCRDHNRRGLLSLRHLQTAVEHTDAAGPEDDVVRTEGQAQVLDALHRLSPRQRECLVLRFYFDLSETEIAKTLTISPNSVKTHCQRGMAAMRQILEEEE
ncbi:MAG: SigE family RNA polymerase sigma factor [Acidimicrobiia bacterium]|nr:SigE family RNA polymerase sigma factor [Acidimicrobiia bacterium]